MKIPGAREEGEGESWVQMYLEEGVGVGEGWAWGRGEGMFVSHAVGFIKAEVSYH